MILWYGIIEASLASIPYNSTAITDIVFLTMFFFYPVFGMVADVWCGRMKLMIIGTWITWVGAISVAIYVLSTQFIANQSNALLITILQSVQLVGTGIFQANALQFGIDQLQDASSEQYSSFMYWYIWFQEISSELYKWVDYGASSIASSYTPLIMLLLVITLLSILLCTIPCFTSQWDFKAPVMHSNPYTLMYQVLCFTMKHKHAMNRSAFTYWEDQRPSRIELGESKYGGPFSHEQIEDVKVLFKITKLMLLLTGLFICLNAFDTHFKISQNQELTLIFRGIRNVVVLISLPLHELLIYPCFKARYPGALTRTSIGAVLSLLVIIASLLIDALGHIASGAGPYTLPWLNMLLMLGEILGYLILTTSLLEFVVAQSPQSMTGLLIGIYYCVRYGLSQAGAWLLYLPLKGPDYSATFHNDTAYLTLVTALGIVSIAAFVRAAQKYKYREREEVVPIHIFAEQYYGIEGVET